MIISNVDWSSLEGGEALQDGRRVLLPHKTLIQKIRSAVTHGGFEAETQLAWLSLDRKDLLSITTVREVDRFAKPGPRLSVGVRQSHRPNVSFRWYHGFTLGDGGGVCLMRSPEGKRHSSEQNLEQDLERCMDVLAVRKKDYSEHSKHLQVMKMDRRRWREHLVTRVREGKQRGKPTWRHLAAADRLFVSSKAQTVWDGLTCFSRACSASGPSKGWNAYLLDQLFWFYEPFSPSYEEGEEDE